MTKRPGTGNPRDEDETQTSNIPPASHPGTDLPPGTPRRIHHYEIRRVIASGGMGTVFEAIQDNPHRSVAIKVMKLGMVSASSLKRFEIESQILAKLRHAGIAQVYEAGTFDDGSGSVPFFAMEYIPNAKSITEYANEKKLSTRERLELFSEVCDAVHHGHQRGVIHRDLKPNNILVDSHGRPKIIDFGVARSLDSERVQASIQTEYGQLVGSLPYMSPEQFDADQNDLDIRSDVYSLGVVLYELLSGSLPYTVDGGTIYETARIVKEEEPIKLSLKAPALGGEVETIVGKALEKDRDRRYQSAHGLAQDIRRYLSGDAIVARPPSFQYQMSVFARRNKILIGATAAVFVVLIAGVAVSASLFFQAAKERDRAEIEGARAKASSEFLTNLLSTALPHGYGDQITVHDLLDLSTEEIKAAFPHDPELESDIRMTLGWGYVNVGYEVKAEEHFQRAYDLRLLEFGQDHPKTVDALEMLKLVYQIWGYDDELLAVGKKLLEIEARVSGTESEAYLSRRMDYVYALEAAEELREAAEVAEETLTSCQTVLGDEHDVTLEALGKHAWLLFKRGELDQAEQVALKNLESARANSGEKHEATREAKSLLGAIYIAQGRIEKSKELYKNRHVPRDFQVLKTYQGTYNPATSETQILVFWETWCPYSQRTVPGLERVHQQYKNRGVDVVGLTRVNRGSSDEKVMQFIKEKNVTYPIVKEAGDIWNFFDCDGTPWIAVVQDGVMVWENYYSNPESFPYEIMDQLVAAGSS